MVTTNKAKEIKIGCSRILVWTDQDLEKEIKKTKTKLKNYRVGKGLIFVDYANIKENCLNDSKRHLIRKVTILIKNFLQIVFF